MNQVGEYNMNQVGEYIYEPSRGVLLYMNQVGEYESSRGVYMNQGGELLLFI